MTIALLLVGFGNAARRFVQLLEESRQPLAALGVNPAVIGITTRHHGRAFDPAGFDPARAGRWAAGAEALPETGGPSTVDWITSCVAMANGPCVVVETTTLDVHSAEPALSHVRAALAAGAHVVTANKGPVAIAGADLIDDARARGLSFLFEGAVLDGIPVFSLVRETLAAVTIAGFRGVVNSTTNHILTALERGEPFETALARMQADGIAEADPSLDVDGWDAAAKVAAMANVWLDARTQPARIRREGLNAATADRVRSARARGRRLKLVAWARRAPGRVDAAVELQELALDDPLAILDGQGNALEIDTWPLGRIVITQRDGGLEKTAQALVSDLVTVVRRLRREVE